MNFGRGTAAAADNGMAAAATWMGTVMRQMGNNNKYKHKTNKSQPIDKK